MADVLACGCDPMVVEDAESCKRCDDERCEPNGCERLQAARKHSRHRPILSTLFSVQHNASETK